ncbi:MAG: glycosyltransferase family 2 protein [Alphaproteobacteria bacterium]|nr:glycosyltransferase family 2 protein [Alphaproteobacteria bacterium]
MSVDVSVIIAAYNVESYIERAVRSVLDQQDISFEIIAVDDCSTDNTFAVLNAIRDPRLKIMKTPKNAGPGAARNTGIKAAAGKWIAILDGDDAFAPGRLAACIKRGKEDRAQIVVDNITVCREDTGAKFPMFPLERFGATEHITLEMFLREKFSPLEKYTLGYLKPIFSATFLREKHLTYNEALPIGEDWLIVAQSLAEGAKCSVDPGQGYLYTARSGSISYRQSADSITAILDTDQSFLNHYGPLSAPAMEAFARRTRTLKRRLAFTHLVNAIKQKNIPAIIKAIHANPACILYLWQPVKARIERITSNLGGGTA